MLHRLGASIFKPRTMRVTRGWQRRGQDRGHGVAAAIAIKNRKSSIIGADNWRGSGRAVRFVWTCRSECRDVGGECRGASERSTNRQIMRNGQKRMRGRGNNNHRKSQNPLTRVYEFERTRREDPRHRLAHRGKIHPARARLAELGRPGGGRKLLSACRALFPPDRRRAGTVPPAEPVLQSTAAAAGPGRAAGRGRRQLRRRRRRWASPTWARTSRALRRSHKPQEQVPQGSATLSAARRAAISAARSAAAQPPATSTSSPISSRTKAAMSADTMAACPPSSPAAAASRNRIPARTRTATTKATARIASASPAPASSRRWRLPPGPPRFSVVPAGRGAPTGTGEGGGDEPRQPD